MKLRLVLLLVIFPVLCYAQLSTNESPVSWSSTDVSLLRQTSDIPQVTVSQLDLDKLQQEDLIDEQNGEPPRFGYPEKVAITLTDGGVWQTLSDGSRIWRVRIFSPDALSINLLYDKFYMPEGGKLFVYATDKGSSIGAFTTRNNKESPTDGFATGLVFSNDITVEYYEPAAVKGKGVLSISYVVSGYRLISEILQEDKALGSSGSCEINVNCPEGDNWQNEKRAVAMILVGGTRICSGSLVNTTANDTSPYFLTANHCTMNYGDAVTSPDLSSFSFYWMYEAPSCTNSSTEPPIYSTSGATIVANYEPSDFSLLRLSEDPKNLSNFTPYYLGWDSRNTSGTGGVAIHHPSGDVKKITPYTITPASTDYLSDTPSSTQTHWRVTWSKGATEGGSSGSPLINSSRYVIGQLHGGYSSCSSQTEPDWYGKVSYSWLNNNASDSRRRLKDWLDPLNVIPSNGGTWDGLDSRSDCVLRIENRTLSTSQTFTNNCPIEMKNVTVSGGAAIVVKAKEYILLESGVEVTGNSSLELSF